MIVDNVENILKYTALNPRFSKVADFLATHVLGDMEPGHYPIEGEDLFVNIQEVPGRTREDAHIEYHRRMIDIQIPISASETYGYKPLVVEPMAGFDREDDIGFLLDALPQGYVSCDPGMFVVFFPQDGHAPLISGEKRLRKAIFKVKA